MSESSTISVRWKMRQPVNFRLLRAACAQLGMDADTAMTDPKSAMDGITPSVGQLQAFVDVVAVKPPRWMFWRKPVDLESMPIDVAMEVGFNMVADFFLDPYKRRLQKLLPR